MIKCGVSKTYLEFGQQLVKSGSNICPILAIGMKSVAIEQTMLLAHADYVVNEKAVNKSPA